MDNESNCLENKLDTINEPCNNCPLVKAVYGAYQEAQKIDKILWLGTARGHRGERGIDSREEYNIINERVLDVKAIVETLHHKSRFTVGEAYNPELLYPSEWNYAVLEKLAKRIMDLYAENPSNPKIQIGFCDMIEAGLINPVGLI